jgi:hypothetical protein
MKLGQALMIALLLATTACTHVAPYQRGKLAHHTMVDDPTGVAQEHVYAVQEGAVGGSGAGGGGCGCN